MKKFKLNKFNKQQAIYGILFMMPWFIGFIIFGLYPMIMSVYYSLCRYDVLRIPQFIGFGNYQKLIFEDPYFWTSISNTLIYTILRVPLCIIGSLLLAVLVNNAVKGVKVFRTIYFIPSIVTGVVLSVVWLWMLPRRSSLSCENRGLSPIVFVGPEVAEYVARPQVVGEELHVFEVIQTARVCQGCVVLAVRENKLRRWCDADCVVRLIQKTPPHIPLEIFDEGREAMGTVCRMIKDFFDLSNSLLHLHIKSP